MCEFFASVLLFGGGGRANLKATRIGIIGGIVMIVDRHGVSVQLFFLCVLECLRKLI